MDHEGNIIRNPNEILHEWSFEQVFDALELKDLRARVTARLRAEAKQKQAASRGR